MSQESYNNQLGIVVNFYINTVDTTVEGLLVSMTETGLRLLLRNKVINTILVVDGSPISCKSMETVCEKLEIQYHHSGRQLSYVEAYNIGWRMLQHPYIGLMANDIAPFSATTLQKLLEWVQKPDIGCTFPYMLTTRSEWDEVQRVNLFHQGRITCEPTTMTLNLNLFKRTFLEEIGGLDEHYKGGYQEPILLHKLRNRGLRAVMVGGTSIVHLDKLTKTSGASNIVRSTFDDDRARWFDEYADFASERGVANIRIWVRPFATTRSLQLLWRIVAYIPIQWLRISMTTLALAIEPFLCRYPTRNDKLRLGISNND